MSFLNEQIDQAVQLINQANEIVAMTGAGISTPSGIPDFRSAKSGLWDFVDPLSVASIYAFRQNPQQFFAWVRPLAQKLLDADPNPAHDALVMLEKNGKLKAIVTQNIDNLHDRAGSKIVHELHGHLRELTCVRCYKIHPSTEILPVFVDGGDIPYCDCGGMLKPNVILFGEQLPVRELVAAQKVIKTADLVLVAGSSLEVAPASDLPSLALENGAKLIMVNYHDTYLDNKADLVIHADVAEVLPRIAAKVVRL